SAATLRPRAAIDPETPAPAFPGSMPASPPVPRRLSSSPKRPARSRPPAGSVSSPLHTSPVYRFLFSAASDPRPQIPTNPQQRLSRTPHLALSQSPAPSTPQRPIVHRPALPARSSRPAFSLPAACPVSCVGPVPLLPPPAP